MVTALALVYVGIGVWCSVVMLGHLANKLRVSSMRIKLSTVALLLLINCTLWLPALVYLLAFMRIENSVVFQSRNNLIRN